MRIGQVYIAVVVGISSCIILRGQIALDERIILYLSDLVILENLIERMSLIFLLPDQRLILKLRQLCVRRELPYLSLKLINVVLFLYDVILQSLHLDPLFPNLICCGL